MTRFTSKYLTFRRQGGLGLLMLDRAPKRNAINDAFVTDLGRCLETLPEDLRVLVIHGAGDHFCAGLDLAEHMERTPIEGVHHSHLWHRVFARMDHGAIPVVAAMHGAVMGGGLELAAACHVRVADGSTFYELPEGRRGIFVGGGASVRVARVIGPGRMIEMMLTGRRYDAADGQRLGLSHELVATGGALERALALAETIAGNARFSNYLMINAITRIQHMAAEDGLFTEALAAALSQTSPDARAGIEAFLKKRAIRFDK